jgi:class 3 adenylate cyclase
MKSILTTLLVILSVFSAIAQTTKQLEREANRAKGEEKVDALYRLAERYKEEDRVRTAKVAIESGDEAMKIGLYRKAYEGYYYAGKVYQERNNVVRAIKAFEQAAEAAKDGALRNELMDSYRELAEMNAAILRSNVALDYYKKYSDLVGNKIKLKSKRLEKSLNQTKETVKQKETEIDQLEEENIETKTMLDSVSKEKLYADLQLAEEVVDKERVKRELADERNRRNIYIGAAAIALLLTGFFFVMYRNKRRSHKQLEAKNKIIEAERQKSEQLLLNILPSVVAGELKEKGSTTPQSYREASVLFTDFKSFTTISEKLSPIELVEEINHCFTNFDRIIEKYNIEKIKTIGDAYLCVSGLPQPADNHAEELIRAAIEMQAFMKELAAERMREGRLYFEMRLGIHTGPLVAGVVGSTKFAYDIWGDTVNTAARMEQNCEPGMINVSEGVKNICGDTFEFQFRGKIEAKNKGELAMYYVNPPIHAE